MKNAACIFSTVYNAGILWPNRYSFFNHFKIFSLFLRLPNKGAMNLSVTHPQKRTIIQAVRDHSKRLFSFIRGRVPSDEDAEDILQDVWYQFSRVLNTEPIEQVSSWLFRVARNRIIDQYRKQQPGPLEDERAEDDEEDGFSFRELLSAENPGPETKQFGDLFWETLFAALDEIPEEQRQVFVWHEVEGLPFHEISRLTGEKVNTLISRKRYAVLHLRKRLKTLHQEINEP